MIFAPRSWPSSPGFATTTLILLPSIGRGSLRCGAVTDRRTLLAGIVLLAVIVRLAGIGDRLSEDEGFSWLVASAPDAGHLPRPPRGLREHAAALLRCCSTPLPLDDEHWLRLPSLVAVASPACPCSTWPSGRCSARAPRCCRHSALAVAPYAVNWSNFSRGFMLANLGLLIALWAVVRLAGDGRQALVVGLRGRRRARDLLRVRRAALPGRADRGVRVDRARPPSRGPRCSARCPVLALLPWLGEFAALARRARRDEGGADLPLARASRRCATRPCRCSPASTAPRTRPGPRTVQFLLIVAALTAAVLVLRARGKRERAPCCSAGPRSARSRCTRSSRPLGPDIFAQRYLTSLIPLAVALLAGGDRARCRGGGRRRSRRSRCWDWASRSSCSATTASSSRTWRRSRRSSSRAATRAVLTNSARVAFYLRDLEPRLDRPLGFGAGPRGRHAARDCPVALAIVDDERAPAGVRDGPWRDVTRSGRSTFACVQVAPNRAPWGSMGEWIRSPAAWRWSSSAALGGGPDARPLPVTVQDDALMLHRSPAQVQETARRMARLGVDRVRLTASWSALAPRPRLEAGAALRCDELRGLPARAVGAASTGPSRPRRPPASTCRSTWRSSPRAGPSSARSRPTSPAVTAGSPNPEQFAALRRGGRAPLQRHATATPRVPSQRLPAVRLWTTWNEPNHGAFLLPQWRRSGGTWIPQSPHIYRELHERGLRGDQGRRPAEPGAAGRHRRPGRAWPRPAQGDPAAPVPARARLRRPARPPARSDPRATASSRSRPTAGHTTPTRSTTARTCRASNPDDVQMGDLERLSRAARPAAPARPDHDRLPIFLTEYGYETNPPDVDARRLAQAAGALPRPRDLSRLAAAGHRDVRAVPAQRHRPTARRGATIPRRPHATGTAGSTSTTGGRRSPPSRRSRSRSGPRHGRSRARTWSSSSARYGRRRAASGWRSRCAARRNVDPDPDLRDACRGRPHVRRGDDVVPDRHRGLLPARRAVPGSGHVPRPLDQDRRDAPSTAWRSRCAPAARLLTDDDLHPHLARMGLAEDLPGPDLAERVAELPFGLVVRPLRDVRAAGLLDGDVVHVRALPDPADLVALVDLDRLGLEEVVLDLDLGGRGERGRDEDGGDDE